MLGPELSVVLGLAVLLCAVAARRFRRTDDTVLRQVQPRLDIEEVRRSGRELAE